MKDYRPNELRALDDARLCDIVSTGGGVAMLAAREIGIRLSKRKDGESLRRMFKARVGVEFDKLLFTIGGGGSHVSVRR